MNIPLRSEYDQNPLGFASSRSELWCKHLPQRPAGFHGINVWHSNSRISSVYHQNSSHLSISKKKSVHKLEGMIPQRADALLQSSKCFVCARLHLDLHEKPHSRPKSSDVFHLSTTSISSTTLRTPAKIRNVYVGLLWRPFSSKSNPVLSVSRFA